MLPDDVPDASMQFVALDRLKGRSKCGFTSFAAHIRWTLAGEMPTARAMLRQLQRGWPTRG